MMNKTISTISCLGQRTEHDRVMKSGGQLQADPVETAHAIQCAAACRVGVVLQQHSCCMHGHLQIDYKAP